jgi:hypothetical protein
MLVLLLLPLGLAENVQRLIYMFKPVHTFLQPVCVVF